ncbi:MAG: hypothetical protein GXO25_07915 [Euryarchaeota archaeon]|nr:hypothetical protein [Euryarchaeota archaeon]
MHETFESLADTEQLRDIYEKIKNEDDRIIRNMWIEKFFQVKFGTVKIEGKYAVVGAKKYRIYR